MSDLKKIFNELALESILFKGQYDWYFCFLKSEKITHVLALLSEKMTESAKTYFTALIDDASALSSHIAYFAAGDMDVQLVLADIFSLMSGVRLSATRGALSKETALYIVAEYEKMVEKLAAENRPSPFVSPQDFAIPEFLTRPQPPRPLPLSSASESLSGQDSGYISRKQPLTGQKPGLEEMGDRSTKILNFVLQNKAVSIKEICAVMPECSEKTVQRELIALISRGLIKREGERRWSVYKPA